MTWWPGWNSIEGAGWWSGFYFWFGIAALFVLGITEVISHHYGLRKDELIAVAEHNTAVQRQQQDADVQARHDAEAATLRQQVAEANQRATSAVQQAATAGQKATTLEAKQAARHLTDAQKQTLISALKPFAGQKVDIVSIIGDGDGDRFKQDFIAVLTAANWSFDPKANVGQVIIMPTPMGIQVTMNQTEAQAGRVLKSVEVFVVTLENMGLTRSKTIFVNQDVPVGAIKLIIGTKP